jgi:hypothetical protein
LAAAATAAASKHATRNLKALLYMRAQVEVEVLVPLAWPSDADAEQLRVVHLMAPSLSDEAGGELLAAVNGDQQLLARCDVLGLMRHVAEAVEQRVLDAAAA